MMKINVTSSGDGQKFLAEIEDKVKNRRALHAAMGTRFQEELSEYFLMRDKQPNKRGWNKQGWWAGVEEAMSLTKVDDAGAEVTIAHDKGFRKRVEGGEIKPIEANSLTIPNVEEAYGKSVAEYEQATGRRLFTPVGARYMAYGDGESVTLVYFLVKSVTITADEKALPPEADLLDAMREEITDYLEFN